MNMTRGEPFSGTFKLDKETNTVKKLISILFVSFMLTALGFAQESASLASVKKINVGSMGQSDEADRFRMLLEEELHKAGFNTVDDDSAADAVLTGVLSVRVYADTSLARATVALKTPDGPRIGGRDLSPTISSAG